MFQESRRTSRLEPIVHHLGVALGGRSGADPARHLMLPVSKDTLLRVVRRRVLPDGADTVNVLGIDDFAWKRGQRYGTLLCNLERRRIIDLLPDREAASVEAWLAAHPEITIISRDRGGGYGQAATKAAPQAVQVADRWHLMDNASAAFLDAVRRSMRQIRQALCLASSRRRLPTWISQSAWSVGPFAFASSVAGSLRSASVGSSCPSTSTMSRRPILPNTILSRLQCPLICPHSHARVSEAFTPIFAEHAERVD